MNLLVVSTISLNITRLFKVAAGFHSIQSQLRPMHFNFWNHIIHIDGAKRFIITSSSSNKVFIHMYEMFKLCTNMCAYITKMHFSASLYYMTPEVAWPAQWQKNSFPEMGVGIVPDSLILTPVMEHYLFTYNHCR